MKVIRTIKFEGGDDMNPSHAVEGDRIGIEGPYTVVPVNSTDPKLRGVRYIVTDLRGQRWYTNDSLLD